MESTEERSGPGMPSSHIGQAWLRDRAMRHCLRILGSLLGLLCAAGSDARTWNVRLDGTGDAPTIQAAIDSATSGDSVLVASGVYDENLDTRGKGLSLIGAAGPDATIVDGGRRERVLTFTSGLVTGLTLRNGLSEYGGAGIWIRGPNSTVFRNNIVENNVAGIEWDTGGGGGIYIDGFANGVLIESNIIRDNLATAAGGGIFDAGPSPQFVLNEIRNNVISGNSCLNFGGGIALFAAVVSGNLVLDNHSERAGAGIAADLGGLPPVGEIRNNTIVKNRAGSQGAGLLVTGGDPLISNNIIAWNGPGGGIVYGGTREPTCNDLWANDVDAVGWSGMGNGNFSADPLFCNPEVQNYSLFRNSPCLPTANPACGLVGAFDAGCTVSVKAATWTLVKELYRDKTQKRRGDQ